MGFQPVARGPDLHPAAAPLGVSATERAIRTDGELGCGRPSSAARSMIDLPGRSYRRCLYIPVGLVSPLGSRASVRPGDLDHDVAAVTRDDADTRRQGQLDRRSGPAHGETFRCLGHQAGGSHNHDGSGEARHGFGSTWVLRVGRNRRTWIAGGEKGCRRLD